MSDDTKNPNTKHYSAEDVKRLKELVKEGQVVLSEIETLRDGLNDTIKAVAEEVGVKAAQLKKVITIAHKQNLGEVQEKMDEVVDLLDVIGYKGS